MSAPASAHLDHLEGELRITLFLQGEHLRRFEITSSRPQLAQRLLAGHTPVEACERVARVYTLCRRAQRLAAEVALEAANGEASDHTEHGQHLVLAEQAREHVWQLLIPNDRQGAATALKVIAQAKEAAKPLAAALEHVLTEYLLGEPPAAWQRRDASALRRWCERAATVPAQRIAQALREPEAAICQTRLLPPLTAWRSVMIHGLAQQALAEPAFCAQPLWLGSPAETGAYARLHDDPTLSAWTAEMGRSSAARLLARLLELARLPTRLREGGEPVVRAWSLGDGIGAAGVETARGLLLHVARIADGRVSDYRILAPTEWNFHPAGPLAEALTMLPPGKNLAERVQRLVDCLDPCVTCRVELCHA